MQNLHRSAGKKTTLKYPNQRLS